jgi:hypothetical protein
MSTVYIFGAGASRHVGYPLASTMGTELLQWMLTTSDVSGQFQPTAELVINRFGEFPNIEDVITQLSSAIKKLHRDVQEENVERTILGNARGWMAAAIREWFREIHNNGAPFYSEFAQNVVVPGDAIVTFNYDDSVERELSQNKKWELSTGYGFSLGPALQQSPILMLKLHGSVNWLTSLFGGATTGPIAVGSNLSMGQHPVIHKADAAYLGYPDFVGHLYPGGGATPCLIMPGRTKEFFYDTSFGREFTEFWDQLWLQASEALKRSDRIVLIGYSLLRVDERACDLILRTPHKNTPVMIVSGEQSERIATDFRDAGFSDVSFENARFEQWLEKVNVAAGA